MPITLADLPPTADDIAAIWIPETRAKDWTVLCPEIQLLVVDFAEESTKRKWPLVMIGDAKRTEKRQREFYPDDNPLRYTDHFAVKDPDDGKEKVCALDFRTKHYTPGERDEVLAWMAQRCPDDEWQRLYHNVGQGMHLHVGYRKLGRLLKPVWLIARDRGDFNPPNGGTP